MNRRTPLKARTPLSRFRGLSPAGGKRAGTVKSAARKKRPETGFPRAVKLAVRARAGGGDPDQARCEATGVWLGRYGGEIQHRDARGMGGSKSANSIVNAVLLSSEAHRLAEARNGRMNAEGFWLRNGEDPARTPILLHSPHGSGVTAWLTPDGGYSTEPPEAVAA